jgi:hypothetical protein
MEVRAPYQVALVQMAMSNDPQVNLDVACAKIREAASRGAKVVCLPELFRSPYFCQKEDTALFALAETIPGPSTEALGWEARRSCRRGDGLHVRATCGRPITTTPPWSSARTAPFLGMYRKMHIPDDPSYYEKFYFTPGRSRVSASFPRSSATWACSSAGISGSRSRAPHGPARGRRDFLSHGHRLAPGRKAEHGACPAGCLANGSARARHRQRRVRGGRQPRGIGNPAGPTRPGVLGHELFLRSAGRCCLPKRRASAQKSFTARWIPRASRTCAATGPSCAIAASTRTPASTAASWTETNDEHEDTRLP